MTIVNLRTLLDHAQQHCYAIPAFNINFQAQADAVLDAALACESPAIIQISTGGLQHISPWMVEGLLTYVESLPIPVCIHRDHTYELNQFLQAKEIGWFTSLMMDGSISADGNPRSFNENVLVTQQAIKALAGTHISIEAEIGCLGALNTGSSGEEDGHRASRQLQRSELLTCPDQAAQFIELAPVDALAIAIGTSHGAYKFQSPPDEDTLCIQQVKALNRRLPKQHFVLHGCSSVDAQHLETINQYGGHMPSTFGVPIDAICEAIPYGVRKVNIDTDLRLGCTASIRKYFSQNPQKFDPRAYLSAAKEEMQAICEQRFNAFGCRRQAPSLIQSIYETTSA